MEAILEEMPKNWLTDFFDDQTKTEIQELIDKQYWRVKDRFYKNLIFGTEGCVELWGQVPNRDNKIPPCGKKYSRAK